MRTGLALIALVFLTGVAPAQTQIFTLHARSRVETAPGSQRYHAITSPVTWNASQTAVVICDMWDKHWCPGATGRVGEMAPRMNELVTTARKSGSLIIHCPSDTMEFYKDTPQRKLAQSAPKVDAKVPLQRWCRIDLSKEGKLPIDDSDGGCEEAVKNYKAWTRQHEAIQIRDGDAVTDSEEAYYLMRQRGITNVVVMGVHTNMCVLGRPFGIRQLVQQGLNVVLVRDMTDTMYNPAKPIPDTGSLGPVFVSHATGTDRVVEHIEKYWCPSVTSVDFLGGKEFRFREDTRPHLVIVAAEDEYKTETTLPAFALKHLGKDYRVSFVFADAKSKSNLPGIDVLKSADAVLFSVRRKPLVSDELAIVRDYVASGKPVIAIRTSSHAFAPRKGEALPAGVDAWEAFDKEILGCEYKGHHSNKLTTRLTAATGDAKPHPVLAGIPSEFVSPSWLYRSNPLAKDAIPLLIGVAGDHPAEPAAWVREKTAQRGRVFYTCLGHVGDFELPAFQTLLANGIRWAAPVSK